MKLFLFGYTSHTKDFTNHFLKEPKTTYKHISRNNDQKNGQFEKQERIKAQNVMSHHARYLRKVWL